MSGYKHWKLTKDDDAIVWLGFDKAGESVNSISNEVLDELNSILLDLHDDKTAKGLIVHSLKPKGFIAGADVKSFSQFDAKMTGEFLRHGLTVFSRLEHLDIPTVAMIDGFCMGGGYELALACRYRIASDAVDTKLGLPEVMLGIHPGWGGTVRLPKLIGGFQALSQVMLSGAPISASRARAMGMVDDVVPYRQLKRAARYYILNAPKPHQPSFMQSLTNYAGIRSVLAFVMSRKVSERARKEHYPAPYAMLDLFKQEGANGARAYLKETDSVLLLATQTETAPNLIRAFLLRERMKAFAKASTFKASHVHVIGAGIMGGDIAAWCALRGLHVTLQDKTVAQMAPAMARAYELFKKKLKKPRLIQAAMDRMIPDPDGHGIANADVIIEAVFENLEVKQSIFKTVEKNAKKTAIIATNTSSIPLDEISAVMKKPSRLVGIHYFNPVSKMDLVEVVKSDITEQSIVDDACAFVNQIAKLPLPVKSSPGFLVNRVLMPYLMECVQLLEEGYAGEDIDAAALDFGMMMGPVELADTVGMDVCLAVAENLSLHFGGTVPQRLRDMVASGKLGRKTGVGFYRYRQGKPIKARPNLSKKELIANRLISSLINEASVCLREGVVADGDLLDAGMIFATGFAPFRGGPIHYAQSLDKGNSTQTFNALSEQT